MVLRIFCQHRDCQNMIQVEARLGFREADVLYLHGWKKKNGAVVCKQCLRADQERAESRQKRTA